MNELHEISLTNFGGTSGLRDEGLLESAIASAQNTYFYGGGGVFEIAAAYAFHLAQAQAFLDGNKRTAIASALTFLESNGFYFGTDDGALYDAMIGIAERRIDKTGLASILRAHTTPI